MTRKEKIVIPNITFYKDGAVTFRGAMIKGTMNGTTNKVTKTNLEVAKKSLQQRNLTSRYGGQSSVNFGPKWEELTNLSKAKMVLANLNKPKLSNLEKAKRALKIKENLQGNPLYYPKDFLQNLNFKLVASQEKDFEKAKLMTELIKQVVSWDHYKKYDKNTNKSRNS